MIFKRVSFDDFVNEFKKYDRKNKFSYAGLTILYDYIDEYSEYEEPFELDVISLCEEYSEHTLKGLKKEYSGEAIKNLFIIEIPDTDRVIVHK